MKGTTKAFNAPIIEGEPSMSIFINKGFVKALLYFRIGNTILSAYLRPQISKILLFKGLSSTVATLISS